MKRWPFSHEWNNWSFAQHTCLPVIEIKPRSFAVYQTVFSPGCQAMINFKLQVFLWLQLQPGCFLWVSDWLTAARSKSCFDSFVNFVCWIVRWRGWRNARVNMAFVWIACALMVQIPCEVSRVVLWLDNNRISRCRCAISHFNPLDDIPVRFRLELPTKPNLSPNTDELIPRVGRDHSARWTTATAGLYTVFQYGGRGGIGSGFFMVGFSVGTLSLISSG